MPARIPLQEIPATIRAVPDNTKDSNATTRRSIVVCLDGTGDQFDDDNSNIVKIFQALRKDDPRQLTYYQSGVGTYTSSNKGSLKSGLSAALDMAVGASVGVHVREAYSFLMQNYEDGDKISIFGFSRGAYTARALAGMLHKVGLLPAHNQAQIAFAYRWYKDDTAHGWEMSADFKRTFCIDVDVHFLGCWDTVASVGMIPRILPFAKAHNTSVRFFRHALALDEHRAKFKANHWYQRHPETEAQKKEARERQRMEIEHAKRSAGAGRGVHVDQEGHVVSYGAFGSINVGSMRKAADATLNGNADVTNVPTTTNATRRNSTSYEFGGSLKKGLASVGRRRSSISINTEREDGNRTDSNEQKTANKFGSLRRSSILPSKSSGGELTEEPQDRDDPDEPLPDPESIEHDKGTSKSKVKKSQNQINLMKQFNEKDEMEWGRTTHDTDVLEVWFSGCHADVGSGAVPNKTRHMISRIPLRWMLRQAFLCDTGILFRSDVLAEHGLDVDTLYPRVLQRKPAVVGPSPTDMDRYAQGKLPSLEHRRELVRRSTRGGTESLSSPSLTTPTSPPQVDNNGGNSNGETYFSLEKANSFVRKLGPILGNAQSNPTNPGSDSPLEASQSDNTSSAGNLFKDGQREEQIDILSEVHEDYFDCQAAINDQLVDAKGWWILEVIPIKFRIKEKDGTWRKKIGLNMGRYRTVREPRPKMHWTVVQRQQLLGYEIKCITDDDVIWDVVM
ncbi:unnamed protein product [Sympodiomycopsis kandeliae]